MKKLFLLVIIIAFAGCANEAEPSDNGGLQVVENENAIEIPVEIPEEAESVLLVFSPPEEIYPQRIRIEGNEFVVGDEPQRIWINGVNTPWNAWNDFSGNNFDYEWWDGHFAELRASGINASRVWVNCTNNVGRGSANGQESVIEIDENGMISGVSEKHFEHLDSFFEIAERHGIYIMATILSFDHFNYNEWHNSEPERWLLMLQSEDAINSFVEHYTLPFVERYKDNPFLWSIDLMNEPDWVHEGDAKLDWEDISFFFAKNAAAIRENSDILVTVGMAFSKYHSDFTNEGYSGNMVSDEFLQSLYDNEYAALDFWSPHYYDWVGQWFGHPFTSSPYGRRSGNGWGLCDSKPALIGESTANGTAGFTLTNNYVNALSNGWQGVMAWTSNGVDDNGDLSNVAPATKYIAMQHPDLVFPPG